MAIILNIGVADLKRDKNIRYALNSINKAINDSIKLQLNKKQKKNIEFNMISSYKCQKIIFHKYISISNLKGHDHDVR